MTVTHDSISRSVRETDSKFAVERSMFTDLELYELEMEHIFEGNWIYMCHESQIPKNNDFLSGWMGRKPVVITRNAKGEIGGFVNVCAHRGATVCREKRGNSTSFTCPFHGWSYDINGALASVRAERGAGYPADFDKKNYGMPRIPRVESYRGFVFASLSDDVVSLKDYLGGAAFFLDLVVDQAPNGIEVLRGSSTYIFNGNWKLQMENGADGYHVAAVHSNYVSVLRRREAGDSAYSIKTLTPGGVGKRPGGSYGFEHGHVMLWSQRGDPAASPNFPMQALYQKKYGEERAFWMLGRSRNLGLYPNLFLMDSMSTQIRQFRPTSPTTTEVTSYCFAPAGEDAESRSRRLRQFEDFYNASGMATPDDLAEFQAVQQGHQGTPEGWNDLSRGAQHWVHGADELAKKSGFNAAISGELIEDEGLFITQHKAWQNRMRKAIDAKGRKNT